MRLLTNEVLRVARTSGFDVGDAQAPADDSLPYAVVYSLDVGELDGPMNDTTADGWASFQVTAVGETREQAQGLSDKLEPILMAGTYTVAGKATTPIVREESLPIERDDSEKPPLFYQTKMYRIFVTPSP